MGKKKISEHDQTKQKQHHENTEYKDINNNIGGSGTDNPDTPGITEKEKIETENEIPVAGTTDKAVTEDKTLLEKLAEMQDKYLRLTAEFDNYRKRTLREKIDLSKYAGENLLLKLLPVMDDFERAISHMDTATDFAAMKNGIELIYSKFNEFLNQNGVREVESLNCDFNVELHDAVAKIEVEDTGKKGKIVDVIQKGYYLQDKVIRHSKVVIGE